MGRTMRSTDAMLEEHGYSENCEGCRFKQAGLKESRAHTEACRRRIEEAVAQTEDGQKLRDRADQRINQRMAEEVERMDRERPAEEEHKEVVESEEPASNMAEEGEDVEMTELLRETEILAMVNKAIVDITEVYSHPGSQ